MGIDKATIHRIGRQTIRGENTPQGDNTLIVPRRNVHAPAQEWAYNTTGYELKAGYIVEVTDFDPDQNKYTIQRPSADGLSNIAVVKSSLTPAGNGNRVELQFSGTSLLWYSGTAPTIADTVGSQKDSFLVKIGASGFAPLETGATVGGSGRCRARFFSASSAIQHWITGENSTNTDMYATWNYTPDTRSITLESDIRGLIFPINIKANKEYLFSRFGLYVSPFPVDESDETSLLNLTVGLTLYLYDESENKLQSLSYQPFSAGGNGTSLVAGVGGFFSLDNTLVLSSNKTISKYKWGIKITARNSLNVHSGSFIRFNILSYKYSSLVVQI